ncbi:MAG: hypothetical protein WBC44_16090, partial [Planctomycetaceae bacterium]
LLTGEPDARSPHDAFFYYLRDELRGVRSGEWKLYLPVDDSQPARLYDLTNDLAETRDVAAAHPDVIERLTRFADEARAELGDGEEVGTGQRPAGVIPFPTARILDQP